MSDATTNLELPFLAPAQAQKHVTVNEALLRLDALVQLNVASRTLAAQPAAAPDGTIHILPPGKTGVDWGPMANGALAYWRDGIWEALTPKPGWSAFVRDEGRRFAFRDGGWRSEAQAGLIAIAPAAVPAGWLVCDGRLVARAAYPTLFTAIGATYGAGDGATSFALPDLRPRNVGLPTGMAHVIATGD